MEWLQERLTPALPLLHPPVEDPLARRIAAGEHRAIAEAYELHQHAVRGFARRLVGDESVAEDLVHEVFITLPSAMKGFRHASSLRTFLVSIAANHARHHIRAAARRRAALTRLGEEPGEQDLSTPEDGVARKRLAATLSRALDDLPVEQRLAFVLCAVEERSSSEVARMVRAPEATVRTRLHHAKKKLRGILTAEGFRRADAP